MNKYPLAEHWSSKPEQEAIRTGFGRGLLAAAKADDNVVGLCADLTESTKMHLFRDSFPERFVEIGIAEQNLVTYAAGMARAGKVPFTSSYAAFSPGRNWEQIRTTACLNNVPVKVVGSHAGLSVGPDGATHQMLEDIALMRALPNMVVIAPGDSIEAEKATMAIAKNNKPSYVRLARENTPIFSTKEAPFSIGKAYVLREGTDITLFATGTMTYQALKAAEELSVKNVSAEVVHVPTIKPLDTMTILASAEKTKRVVSCEEAQVNGGFGSAIAELLVESMPIPMVRIGVKDAFGESGKPDELFKKHGLDVESIVKKVQQFIEKTPRR